MRWRRIFPFDGWVLYSHEIKSKALTTLRLRSGQAPDTEVHKGEPPGRGYWGGIVLTGAAGFGFLLGDVAQEDVAQGDQAL
jgi:hypothetical protein